VFAERALNRLRFLHVAGTIVKGLTSGDEMV